MLLIEVHSDDYSTGQTSFVKLCEHYDEAIAYIKKVKEEYKRDRMRVDFTLYIGEEIPIPEDI